MSVAQDKTAYMLGRKQKLLGVTLYISVLRKVRQANFYMARLRRAMRLTWLDCETASDTINYHLREIRQEAQKNS